MDWPEQYDGFFSRLDRLSRAKDGWKAACPAHEDRLPSLWIKISESGNLLVKCWAGCTFKAIVGATGLREGDFFMAEVKPEFVCAYDYCYPKGVLRHQTVRMKPKAFRQRRPNPNFLTEIPDSEQNPKWFWNLEGVDTVLYKSPEIEEEIAKAKDRRVFLVEGESDADTLWKLGFVATTNPMGAGKWKDAYTNQLRECNVVVIPDEDEPGLNHATRVTQALLGKAKSVVVARLPRLAGVKTDVSAWLATLPSDDARKQAVKDLVKAHDGIDPMIVLAPPCTNAELLALATKLVCGVSFEKRELISAIALLRKLETEV
jgi:putative DNA primase/helicase